MRFSKFLAITLALSACQSNQLPGDVGAEPPAYAAAILQKPDSLRLSDLKGSVVLLNVWATWCIPCRKEIPELQVLHQRYSKQGLRVVGVSVDDAGADGDVADFAIQFGMTYTLLRDADDRVSDLFRTPGVPSSFLIDRDGVVRWRHLGPFKADDPDFQQVLQHSLAASS